MSTTIVREGPAYLPAIDEQPTLDTIDLRPYGMEAALYVNEWNEVVAYFDVAYGCLREQQLVFVAVFVLGLDWAINREYLSCTN